MYNSASNDSDSALELLIIGDQHDVMDDLVKPLGNLIDYITFDKNGLRRREHKFEAYKIAWQQKEKKLRQFKPELILIEGVDYGNKHLGKVCETLGGQYENLSMYSANEKCALEGMETDWSFKGDIGKLGGVLINNGAYIKNSNEGYVNTIDSILRSPKYARVKKVAIQIGFGHLTANKDYNLKGCNLQEILHSKLPEAKIKVYIPPAYSYIDSVNGTRGITINLKDIPNYRGKGKKEPWLVNNEPKKPGLWEKLKKGLE
jgi:hypothetical protein